MARMAQVLKAAARLRTVAVDPARPQLAALDALLARLAAVSGPTRIVVFTLEENVEALSPQLDADAWRRVRGEFLARLSNGLANAPNVRRVDLAVHSLKDLPTLAEAGYPQIESLAWNGLFTAAGTPKAVVDKINADVNTALNDPAIKAALDSQGLTAVGGSAEDFKRLLDADAKRWGAIIQKAGIKLDQ